MAVRATAGELGPHLASPSLVNNPGTAYPFSSASARCGVGHGAPDCVDHGSARLPAQLVGVPKPVHVRLCRSPLSRGVPWPEGFRCPGCGDGSSYRLASRALLQCRACRCQTSVTAGTVLDRTRLPLPLWFAAAYLVTTHTPSFSALQLQRQLGLARYESAWLRQPQDLAARHPPRRRRQAPAPLRRRIRLPLVWGFGCQALNVGIEFLPVSSSSRWRQPSRGLAHDVPRGARPLARIIAPQACIRWTRWGSGP